MASQIRPIEQYVTPNSDIIFFEYIDEVHFDKKCYTLCETKHKRERDFKVVYIGPTEGNGKNGLRRKIYYAADRDAQWKYNYSYRGLYIGGGRFKSYERTYFIPRCDWDSTKDAYGNDLLPGDPDPEETNQPLVTGEDGFVYEGQSMQRSNVKELDACYVMVTYRFAKICSITKFRFDADCNKPLPVTIETVPRHTNPQSSPVNELGEFTEISDLNCNWTQVVTTQAGCVEETKTYETYINFRWPNVLDTIEFMRWYRLNRTSVTYPRIVWKRRAQTIPTRATLTRTFYTTAQSLDDLPKPVNMLPNSMQYTGPELKISIPACLHDSWYFVNDYGNTNSVWDFAQGSTRNYPATTLTDGTEATDWPDELLISVTQKQSKGGFLVETISVKSPVAP